MMEEKCNKINTQKVNKQLS